VHAAHAVVGGEPGQQRESEQGPEQPELAAIGPS
jgi:hypothetical protein